MGLLDSLFGGNGLEEAVDRHVKMGGPADKIIQSILSEMVLIPMSIRCPDQAYLNELVQIMKRRGGVGMDAVFHGVCLHHGHSRSILGWFFKP